MHLPLVLSLFVLLPVFLPLLRLFRKSPRTLVRSRYHVDGKGVRRFSYVFTGLTYEHRRAGSFSCVSRKRNSNFTSAALSAVPRQIATSELRAFRRRIAVCRDAARENPSEIAGARWHHDVSRREPGLPFLPALR